MYYTPIEVVEYILDQVNFKGDQILGKNILDTSCGSGAFLVSACRRQIETYLEYFKAQGKSKGDLSIEEIRQILNNVKQNIFGLELNPFACYLAETNLLIQVLDLIRLAREKGGDVTLDRFSIFNTDTLRNEPETRDLLRGIPFPAEEIEPAEQLKSRLGLFENGFDFVVGNPPYVRADEGQEGLLTYRNEIKTEHPLESIRELLEMKWDLFVPFVGLAVYLLRRETGKLAMITSNAIEQVGYAAKLRSLMISRTVQEVSFFPHVRLFDDAEVENTVVILENHSCHADGLVLRRWHDEDAIVYREERLSQSTFLESCFRQNISIETFTDTTALQQICYLSVGMAAQSDEKRFPGKFTKDALLSEIRDNEHPVAYIEGDSISPFELKSIKFLEYGDGLRAPSEIRRPTFPELYNRPKIMRGRTSHAWLDRGTLDGQGWIYSNHSIMLFVLWNDLHGVENKSIKNEIRDVGVERADLEVLSRNFSSEYLLAVFNNPKAIAILRSLMTSSRQGELQPDDFRKLPIPNANSSEQLAISEIVSALLNLGDQFLSLRSRGWHIKTTERRVVAPAVLEKYSVIRGTDLAIAKVAWGLVITESTAFPKRIRRRENKFFQGRVLVANISNDLDESALMWLERQFATIPTTTSFQAAEADNLKIPSTPDEAVKAFDLLIEGENRVLKMVDEFNQLRGDVDDLVEKLYTSRLI